MRAVHIVPALAEDASGPTYVVTRLLPALQAQGCRADLATLEASPDRERPWLHAFPRGAGPRRWGASPALLAWLRNEAATSRIGVLHNHSLWMWPNVYPGWVARRFRLPYVVSPHGTLSPWAMRSGSPLKRLVWPLLQRPALAPVSCFHATALHERDDIRRWGFRQPVAVIPSGIDLPVWRPKHHCLPRTLLFLGRLHPVKGLDGLLHAWARLEGAHPDWQVRIVGPDVGGHRAVLERLAGRLGLQRVQFAGPLAGEAKWQALAEAELFVLPSHSENFAVAVAEALAAGTPALVSQAAPWGELPLRGAGWWVAPGLDPWVAALDQALGRPAAELSAMGELGRAWMAREFDWAVVAGRMAETYRWLLTGGALPPWISRD
ncbi:MAG: glycosyltransferase [Candidatus Sericytochromatia bacterium]|nr:glycosyltransferase [Candidatus Sericytochromatia bacterium]